MAEDCTSETYNEIVDTYQSIGFNIKTSKLLALQLFTGTNSSERLNIGVVHSQGVIVDKVKEVYDGNSVLNPTGFTPSSININLKLGEKTEGQIFSEQNIFIENSSLLNKSQKNVFIDTFGDGYNYVENGKVKELSPMSQLIFLLPKTDKCFNSTEKCESIFSRLDIVCYDVLKNSSVSGNISFNKKFNDYINQCREIDVSVGTDVKEIIDILIKNESLHDYELSDKVNESKLSKTILNMSKGFCRQEKERTVKKQHVVESIVLFREIYSGETDSTFTKQNEKEQHTKIQRDRIEKITEVINDLDESEERFEDGVPLDVIKDEAKDRHGIDPDKTEHTVRQQIQSGTFYDPLQQDKFKVLN